MAKKRVTTTTMQARKKRAAVAKRPEPLVVDNLPLDDRGTFYVVVLTREVSRHVMREQATAAAGRVRLGRDDKVMIIRTNTEKGL